jgi:hypothetical protein
MAVVNMCGMPVTVSGCSSRKPPLDHRPTTCPTNPALPSAPTVIARYHSVAGVASQGVLRSREPGRPTPPHRALDAVSCSVASDIVTRVAPDLSTVLLLLDRVVEAVVPGRVARLPDEIGPAYRKSRGTKLAIPRPS